VTCTADNCLLTLQPFLTAKSGDVQFVARDGKPVLLSEAVLGDINDAADQANTALLPASATDEELEAAIEDVKRSASLVIAYICSSLMTIHSAEGVFPESLLINKAQAVLELIQLLSGRAVQLPEAPQDRKNEKLAINHTLGCFEALLTFLKAHGAALAHVKPEHLMPEDAFMRWAIQNGSKDKSRLPRSHAYKHVEGWNDVLIQIIKTFVLGRVTPRSFRSLPGMGDAAMMIAKDPSITGSNVYSVAEVVLLKWCSHHYALLQPSAASVTRLISFDTQLTDGHVFAALILSHCPFLAGRGKPTPTGSDPPVGSAVDILHPRPCGQKESVENMNQVLLALDALGIPFKSPRGGVAAEMLCSATARELLLFSLFLYQHLPHYVPKAMVDFQGGLQKQLTKSIELSNPSKRPIAYEVRLKGADCFHIDSLEVRLDPKSSVQFPVNCTSHFMGDHFGRLVFLSRGNGISTANANTLVFGLHATIDIGTPAETFSVESKLYSPTMVYMNIVNPFETACTMKLTMTETKPELNMPAVSNAADKSNSAEGSSTKVSSLQKSISFKKASMGAAATVRAAKIAGFTASALVGGAAMGEDPSKRLPSSFWCERSNLYLEPRQTISLPCQFLPFQLGEYTCTCLFSDESVGEFSCELRGQAVLPPAIETISLVSESASSASRELQLPFRNPLFEKARQAVLDRSTSQREKMSQLWGKEPMLRGPLVLQLSFSSSFFSSASQTLELVDNERRGRSSRSQGGTAAASTVGSGAASAVGTPRGGASSTVSASDANKLLVRFVPNEPGNYTGELLLLSGLDVRVYDVVGSCSSPGMRARLEFVAPARQAIRQEVPIVNGMDVDWTVSAQIKGDDFRGPPNVKIPANTTGYYPLEFTPDWVCEREGELTLSNLNTGDKYHFIMKGIGEEPLAEKHIVLSCVARKPEAISFPVFNMMEKGESVALSVQSDLLHVSGHSSVIVPAREKLKPAEPLDYTLIVNPQMGGRLQGSITFTAPDGRFLWYTVELESAPPPSEKVLEISAPLRKVVAVEIPISNPAANDLEFAVLIQGEGLLGDDTIAVPAGQSVMYELLYSPLVAGTSEGSISFVNPIAGEFWYELRMKAEEAVPVQLPLLHCSVGGKVTHTFTVSNPVGEELPLQVRCDNPRNFKLEGSRGAGLMLPPYGDAEATLTFIPSILDHESHATISLTHPKLGEWVYHARGIGHFPVDHMPVTEVTAPLGHTTSGTVSFRNPFEEPLMLSVDMEQVEANVADDGPPSFELLARRPAHGLVVAPFSSMQLPFSFIAHDMTEQHARLIIHASYKGKPLDWTFPVIGVAVSRPLQKPIIVFTRARQPYARELLLPIPGLQSNTVEEAFTYDLDVSEEDADHLARSLTLTPMQRTLSGASLRMSLDWRPLRPIRSSCALIVRKSSGGRWRYEIALEAGDPEPDDVIHIEAGINKTSAVSFRLANAFDSDANYQAFFTSDSPSVFTVTPVVGVLPRAGTPGTLFTVAYTPIEYGKPMRGMLVILSDEMQWSYEVRGTHPQYQTPVATRDPNRLQQPAGSQGRMLR